MDDATPQAHAPAAARASSEEEANPDRTEAVLRDFRGDHTSEDRPADPDLTLRGEPTDHDLPPDLPRLRTLETWLVLTLDRVRQQIAATERREQSASAASRPGRPHPTGSLKAA